MHLFLPLIACLLTITCIPAAEAYFSSQGVEALRTATGSQSLLRSVHNHATEALSRAPHAQPSLSIEGRLGSPDAALFDAAMQDLLSVALTSRLVHSPGTLESARLHLLSWARIYLPTGNPIDEEGFCLLVAAHELVRDRLGTDDNAQIEGFLRRLFVRSREFTAARAQEVAYSNWESRHLALATAIACSLGDKDYLEYCRQRFHLQIDRNILPGGTIGSLFPAAGGIAQLSGRLDEEVLRGTTFDLLQRDAMEYHVASLEGLVFATLAAAGHGEDWLRVAGKGGQTLLDGLDFTAPYATGARSHQEFARSLADFDHRNGRGGVFDPRLARRLLTLAAALDHRYAAMADPSTLTPFARLLYYSRTRP